MGLFPMLLAETESHGADNLSLHAGFSSGSQSNSVGDYFMSFDRQKLCDS